MELSVLVSLISLSGCFRFALSSVCVGSVISLGLYLLVAPLWWVFSSSGFTGIHNIYLMLYVIRGTAKVKWIKTAGEYSMGFKVLTCR